jgi:hypothetical protein
MMNRLQIQLTLLAFLCTAGVAYAWQGGSSSGSSIDEDLLAAIHDKARAADPARFFGISDYADGRQMLHLTSDRAMIAWQYAQNRDQSSYHDPRPDTVSINCGDEEAGAVFECSEVQIETPDGRTVKPLSYLAGTASYENLLGAAWEVREVDATYPVSELRRGFIVKYASPDGVRRTFVVSSDQAAESLLLGLEPLAEPLHFVNDADY